MSSNFIITQSVSQSKMVGVMDEDGYVGKRQTIQNFKTSDLLTYNHETDGDSNCTSAGDGLWWC